MKNKAFSLMEIMVVIIIVGVLAGLAFPRFAKVMELRKVDVAKQQMEQMRTAIEFLSVNNKSYEFCAAHFNCNTTSLINGTLELDIHNGDFNFRIFHDMSVPPDFLWIIYADRQNAARDYRLEYVLDADPAIICVDVDPGACAWMGM